MKYNISDKTHEFEKKNLVTIVTKTNIYDIYVCKNCGLEGKRFAVNAEIEAPKKKCTNQNALPTHIETIYASVCHVDLEVGKVYEIVPTPKEYQDISGVWVFSEVRQEIVRLLPHEYKVVPNPAKVVVAHKKVNKRHSKNVFYKIKKYKRTQIQVCNLPSQKLLN